MFVTAPETFNVMSLPARMLPDVFVSDCAAVVEPALVLVGTVAGCALLHAVIRRVPVLRPLFGMKRRQASAASVWTWPDPRSRRSTTRPAATQMTTVIAAASRPSIA